MIWYLLKLLVLLPLIGGLAWASLKLAQRMQARFGGTQNATKSVRIIETTMLTPTLKLAVIEFHGREILVSVSRQGLTRLAEAPAREVGDVGAEDRRGDVRPRPPRPPGGGGDLMVGQDRGHGGPLAPRSPQGKCAR